MNKQIEQRPSQIGPRSYVGIDNKSLLGTKRAHTSGNCGQR